MAGKCPECGTPVAMSVHGDLLRYSEPQWVKNLGLGAKLLLIGIILAIGLTVLGIVLGAMRMFSPVGARAVFRLIALGVSVVHWAGSWLLTERDPSGVGEDKYGNVRKFIRITLLFGVASAFVESVFRFMTMPPALSASFGVITGVLSLVGVAGDWALLQYLAKLALRIPDEPLSVQAETLKVWLCGVYAIYLVFGIIESVVFATRGAAGFGGGGSMAVMCGGGIVGLVLFVQTIRYIVMIDRFRAAFTEQARMAQEIWGMNQGQME